VAEEQRLEAEGRCFAAERRRLDAERRLEQVERLLEEAYLAGARMQALVGELGELASQLRRALEWRAAPSANAGPDEAAAAEQRAEMTDALAAAIERLRARWTIDDPVDRRSVQVKAVGEQPAGAPPAPVAARPPHKHSMSAIGRWRNRRKQRHSR